MPRLSTVILFSWMAASAVLAEPAVTDCAGWPGEAIDAERIEALFVELERDPARDLKGVVVSRRGCIVAERYFNGAGPQSLHDIRSAGKSITGTLVGIAIRQGLIDGVDAPIARYLPPGMPPAQQRIRVVDLLTMRAGLDSDDEDPDSAGNEDRLDESAAWLPFAYAVPMKDAPGQRYVYSSLTAFLAGAMVEHASGMTLHAFARKHLFDPLGVADTQWRQGPQGEGVGQGNLRISARDMVRIGQLYLDGGEADGQRLLDRAWVAQALSPTVAIADQVPYADGYGYMWYSRTWPRDGGPVRVHFASGNGGNKIYLVPALELVVAITSSAYGQGYGQRRSEQILLRVLDAIEGQSGD
jgi:CubicO group peptidase (beta-lactamase class C family)